MYLFSKGSFLKIELSQKMLTFYSKFVNGILAQIIFSKLLETAIIIFHSVSFDISLEVIRCATYILCHKKLYPY